MPVSATLYTVSEVAKIVKMPINSLSAYCSQRGIGQVHGKTRFLTEAELQKVKSRPKRGRPKKILNDGLKI